MYIHGIMWMIAWPYELQICFFFSSSSVNFCFKSSKNGTKTCTNLESWLTYLVEIFSIFLVSYGSILNPKLCFLLSFFFGLMWSKNYFKNPTHKDVCFWYESSIHTHWSFMCCWEFGCQRFELLPHFPLFVQCYRSLSIKKGY